MLRRLRADQDSPATASPPRAAAPETFTASDVIQGRLNDCYLMAALLTLTESEHGRALLATGVQATEEEGRYRVRLFDDRSGEPGAFHERWFTVDSTPTETGAPHTAAPWVRAVERAYAQLYGAGEGLAVGFNRIGGEHGGRRIGGARRALERLTGVLAARHSVSSVPAGDLWSMLGDALRAGQPVVAGTPRASASPQLRRLGIYPTHNYAVVGVVERPDGSGRRVRLRNPWGQRFRTARATAPETWDRPTRAAVAAGYETEGALFEVDFDVFRDAFIGVTIGSYLPDTGPFGEVAPAPQATGLSAAAFARVRQAMREGRRQAALDLLVSALDTGGQLDAALLVGRGMVYDETLGEDFGISVPPGYASDPMTGGRAARTTLVQIGPRAYDRGVPLLFSTVLHEYHHVLQFQQVRAFSSAERGQLVGTGGQLAGDEFSEEPARRRRIVRELQNRQETEAYAREILHSRQTGMFEHADLMLDLWRRLHGYWGELTPTSRRLLNDLVSRAHRVASMGAGRALPFRPQL